MKKVLLIAGILIVSIAAVAAATGLTPIKDTWRYKMTVEVETPEGLKTGSAVREVDVVLEPRPGYRPYPYHSVVKVKGEAVVVNLGKRGVLFALLDEDYAYQVVFKAFPGPPGLTPPGVLYYRNLKDAKTALTKEYPTFVIFKDLNDPKTVEQVCEKAFCEMVDNVAHRKTVPFDQLNIKVKAVTIETTRDPITWGIGNRLPWLKKINGGYLDGKFIGGGPELSNILHGGYFERGDGQ